MPAALDVDKEAVKTLALAVGLTEASKQTGISLHAIKQWSSREQWFAKQVLPPTKLQAVTNVTKPSHALANMLLHSKNKVRTNLAKYAVNASTVAKRSRNPLEQAHNVKALAGVMTALWPEENQPGVSINLWGGSGMDSM